MTDKEKFIKVMKNRTKKFSVDIIRFCENLKKSEATSVIKYQIIKSATSVGANYRAACRARSDKEFYSKICIVEEEADETSYWLDLILEIPLWFKEDKIELERLNNESKEITKIMTTAKHSTYEKLKKNSKD